MPLTNRPICAALLFLGGALWSAGASGAPASDGFSVDLIQHEYDALKPATCELSYSLEITNPRSGELSRREAHSFGLLVSSDGLIMAHGHMVLENRHPLNIKVTVGGNKEKSYDAVVLEKPDDVNIAFLRIEPDEGEKLPCATFAPNAGLELGEPVLLFGMLSDSLDYTRAVQVRRIAAVLTEPRTTYALDDAVPFGFVGGPVVNRKGQVVGVVGFDLSVAEGGEIYTRSGHPLVFQTALFQKYIQSPPGEEGAGDAGQDAWLGVFTQPLTDDLAAYWNLPRNGGVVVSTVIPGSPADRAGLRMGDVIVAFNGNPIRAKQDQDVIGFTKLVRESPLDQPLPLQLLRDGQPMDLRLTLVPRPKSGRDAIEYEDEQLGVTVRELTTDVRIFMNLSDDVQGVLVRRVNSGSPAALAGIRPGFLILMVGGRNVTNVEDYAQVINTAEQARATEVTFFCRIGANTAFFRLQPRWNMRNAPPSDR